MQINKTQQTVIVKIPLTTHKGKVRIKQRDSIFESGKPFFSRQTLFCERNYVEWQISYYAEAGEVFGLPGFVNNKREEKTLHELSAAYYYIRCWDLISGEDADELREFLSGLTENKLIDNQEYMSIKCSNPEELKIHGMAFNKILIKRPQLIFPLGDEGMTAEIVVRERQNAANVQPMLFFCFPISELSPLHPPLLGRVARTKECADFVFHAGNAHSVFSMMKIFGMLSIPHRNDILAILAAVESRLSGAQ